MPEPASSAPDAADALRARLRGDLQAALRQRDQTGAALLRSLIAAVDDAQAPPAAGRHDRYVVHVFGDRSAEIPRLDLGTPALEGVLRREAAEREAAAAQLDALGEGARADALRAEAERVRRYLG